MYSIYTKLTKVFQELMIIQYGLDLNDIGLCL